MARADEFDTLMLYLNVTQIDWTRCPIILQDRHNLQRLLGINVSFFRTVTSMGRGRQTKRWLPVLTRHDAVISRLRSDQPVGLCKFTGRVQQGPKISRFKRNPVFLVQPL